MKQYEFETLKSSDVFLMVKLLRGIGINQLKEKLDPDNLGKIAKLFMDKNEGNENKEDRENLIYSIGLSVMLDVVEVILIHLPSCENDIYALLANCSNLNKKEIKELDMVTFTEMIVDFVHKEEFKDFLKVVSKFFK